MRNLEDIRNLFITVKKEHFKVFVENEEKFESEKIRNLNKIALKYFEDLEKVKNINFKNWILFFKLYKYEEFSYKMQNFVILNIPALARILFKIKNI